MTPPFQADLAKCRTKTQISWSKTLRGREEERTGREVTAKNLLSAMCSLFFIHLQEFANFKVVSGKREKCLSRVRGLLEAEVGEERSRKGLALGERGVGGLFVSWGLKTRGTRGGHG